MDCSSFAFYHAHLGLGNIIVDDKRVGIIDWELPDMSQGDGSGLSLDFLLGWTCQLRALTIYIGSEEKFGSYES